MHDRLDLPPAIVDDEKAIRFLTTTGRVTQTTIFHTFDDDPRNTVCAQLLAEKP